MVESYFCTLLTVRIENPLRKTLGKKIVEESFSFSFLDFFNFGLQTLNSLICSFLLLLLYRLRERNRSLKISQPPRSWLISFNPPRPGPRSGLCSWAFLGCVRKQGAPMHVHRRPFFLNSFFLFVVSTILLYSNKKNRTKSPDRAYMSNKNNCLVVF